MLSTEYISDASTIPAGVVLLVYGQEDGNGIFREIRSLSKTMKKYLVSCSISARPKWSGNERSLHTRPLAFIRVHSRLKRKGPRMDANERELILKDEVYAYFYCISMNFNPIAFHGIHWRCQIPLTV